MRSVVVALIPIIALLVSRTIHFNNVLLLLIFVVIVLSLYISGFFLFFHYARLKELKCDRFAAIYIKDSTTPSFRKVYCARYYGGYKGKVDVNTSITSTTLKSLEYIKYAPNYHNITYMVI